MPKKIKDNEKRLETIEYLLAGILLGKKPNIKEVAKIIGCSDNVLTKLYPEKKVKKVAENKMEGKSKNLELEELQNIKKLLILQLIKTGTTSEEISQALKVKNVNPSNIRIAFPMKKFKKMVNKE